MSGSHDERSCRGLGWSLPRMAWTREKPSQRCPALPICAISRPVATLQLVVELFSNQYYWERFAPIPRRYVNSIACWRAVSTASSERSRKQGPGTKLPASRSGWDPSRRWEHPPFKLNKLKWQFSRSLEPAVKKMSRSQRRFWGNCKDRQSWSAFLVYTDFWV